MDPDYALCHLLRHDIRLRALYWQRRSGLKVYYARKGQHGLWVHEDMTNEPGDVVVREGVWGRRGDKEEDDERKHEKREELTRGVGRGSR